jgi:glycosyltransferase involved in cell wall biosynthesis
MNILLAAPHYPPTYVGGVELYTRRLAAYLAGRGHRCEVVAIERLDDGPTLAAEETNEAGTTVWRLALSSHSPEQQFRATYHDPDVERWVGNLLRERRPDVAHLHSGYLNGGAVLSAARAASVPTIVTLHDYWFICPRITLQQPDRSVCSGPEGPQKCAWCLMTAQRRYRLPAAWGGPMGAALAQACVAGTPLRWIVDWPGRVAAVDTRRQNLAGALSTAARVLAPSRFLRDTMVRAGLTPDRIDLLPLGVAERPTAPRRRVDHVRLRLGFLGQIAPHKGLHILIGAVRRLPGAPIELVIQGDLQREPAYVRDLERLRSGDVRVVFAGRLEHADLDRFFAGVDIVAVPSVWYENSPLTIHEARMAGLPVLASNLGGMAELVRDGVDGLLAAAGDPGAFATQIRRLLEDETLLDRLRASVEKPPTMDVAFGALEKIYADVVATRG